MTEEQLRRAGELSRNINCCEHILHGLHECNSLSIEGYGHRNIGGSALGMAKWEQYKPLPKVHLPLPVHVIRTAITIELERLKEEAAKL